MPSLASRQKNLSDKKNDDWKTNSTNIHRLWKYLSVGTLETHVDHKMGSCECDPLFIVDCIVLNTLEEELIDQKLWIWFYFSD